MDREAVLAKTFDELPARYTTRDTMLYALGLGACQDPMDPRQLRYVYEKQLQAIPSLSCVLAHPGPWLTAPELGITWVKLLHAEQSIELSAPLPAEAEITGRYRISGLVDKGPDKGAMMYFEKKLLDQSGELLATVRSTYFLRGDGGCGDWGEPGIRLSAVPEREPDGAVTLRTTDQAALLYRLSGDYNPLHADPEVARKAGFEKPILQGLCTFGIACRSLIEGLCDHDAGRLRGMGARFTKPVYPGETLQTRWWHSADSDSIRFQTLSLDRQLVVLDRGEARLQGG